MIRTYHQHASDSFKVEVIPGTHHCGIDDTHSTFRFSVDIDYTANALDENDFLLDNTYFRQYFNSLGPVCVSCERLASNSVDHLLSGLASRINDVVRVAVRIYPFGDVYVESIATTGVSA